MTPIQNVPLDMVAADPRFAAQFIPSRHAPEPPTRRSPHSSTPSLPRVDSSLGHPVRDDHHQQAVKKANPYHGVGIYEAISLLMSLTNYCNRATSQALGFLKSYEQRQV